MNNNDNQPREFDAVLGGEAPPPVSGVVLGGIEGVKNRLQSSVVEARVAALSEALNYGDVGLDLVIEALQDSSLYVQRNAVKILKSTGDLKAKEALLHYDYNLFFTKLEDWDSQEINHQTNTVEQVSNAYIITIPYSGNALNELILKKPHTGYIEALQCKYGRHTSGDIVINALVNAKEELKNLKALYIGDMHDYEYKTSDARLSDMSPLLNAYPQLEVLQVRGFAYDSDSGLAFKPLRHENLKSLILETGYMLCSKIIDQICQLDLPNLEYLELWLGNDENYYPRLYSQYENEEDFRSNIAYSSLSNLTPIISGKAFPKLKYLGLRSTSYSNAIAETIVQSPLLENLAVLDISMGTLSDIGAEVLLNCPKINQLHTLNVSMNLLSTTMIEKLSNLKCRVVAEPQADSAEYRYYTLSE
ncbi:pentapeptide repeat protein [Calothrix sp. NIES-2100]|uniref:HEAT repeat domain-containing protein n=1 Tax=Calothrix sp. NIES-2100 TaxID=1954172 RepID=UPI000B60F7D9|nr:pentapeptide repeat protein [Calothrix sp. NIES-2100]